jgi:hypothetical protein
MQSSITACSGHQLSHLKKGTVAVMNDAQLPFFSWDGTTCC